jgi:hypothetical protein
VLRFGDWGLEILESVENEETRLVFKQPLKVNLVADEDMLFLSYSALDITAYGLDLREATQAFQDVFISTFVHYRAQPTERLTAEAQDLKIALLELVQEQIDFIR